ncbi:E3 ubiquitin-protein ligase MPSR1-like [Phoenix dactylifera]|uniref:E3 ubiquitin-protein ligase MPSR1-like n=1 Tax=Phoenix dactylifera TaxID=42345 RepID=A0A8B9AAQ9_PHODC|nr:E3 ubiquitin-protein ligase MPSR1-like [Phoenix dactylifera]
MAAESESQEANAEQRMREAAAESESEAAERVREAAAESAGGGERRRFFPIYVGVMGPPPPADGGPVPPPDRIVLVNPLTQGMVVLQGDPELVAELLSGRGAGGGGGSGGPPPASRASIEAMTMVEVGQEGEEVGECPVCLDELAGVVKEMPCRHRFHGQCIDKWLGMHGSCPRLCAVDES